MVKLRLTNLSEAADVDSYFNGFHDGFVKDLCLRSRDLFVREEDGPFGIAHRLTGRFDLELNIAHYNYARGTQPHDRIVHCIFRNVTDFHLGHRQATSPPRGTGRPLAPVYDHE